MRERLTGLSACRVLVVTAPAGHGKTTLLAQLADLFPGPVVWYRADGDDRGRAGLLRRLAPAVLEAVGLSPALEPPADVARLLDLLERARPPAGVLLVLDDFHLVAGSAGGRALLQLVAEAPAWLRAVLAGRDDRDVDGAVVRLAGPVCTAGAEDLRFRSWEVERLFRDVYERPLRPEDAATLTARTEGWAAGLTMFDLLTRSRSPAERHTALMDLARGSRIVRSYLVREVLAELPGDLRDFLRLTSALGVLTGPACDALLGRTGSQEVLEDLERRQLFTTGDGRGHRFRYHQVLQDHLELELSEQLAPEAARSWYRRAGALLLSGAEWWAAFRAFVRAQDWAQVERLLAERGADIVDRRADVLAESLPAALRERDPWLVIAAARVLAARGSLDRAVAAYQRAAALTEDGDVRDLCLRERQALAVWLPGARPATSAAAGVTRAAAQHGPGRCIELGLALPGPQGMLAAGAAALLCGAPERAGEIFAQAAGVAGVQPRLRALAAFGLAAVRLLQPGRFDDAGAGRQADEARSLLAEAEGEGGGAPLPTAWLRLGAGLAAAERADHDTLSVLADEADADGDAWGGGVLRLLAGLAGFPAALGSAEEGFAGLEAPVLVHWARCTRLLRAGAPAGADADLLREGRSLGAPGVATTVRVLLDRVGAEARDDRGYAGGAAPAAGRPPSPRAGGCPQPVVAVRLLSGFEITVEGAAVDLSSVRPRVRASLQFHALHAGTYLHRDVLAAALWPEADLETGRRGVQVAISALRGLLQPGYPRQSTLLPRRADAYALVLGAGGTSDVLDLERLVARARLARVAGDRDAAVAAWRAVAELYRGELLPEQGSAEWVVAERDRLRLAAADALENLGRALVSADAVEEGIDALHRALDLDRFRDGTWGALVAAYEALGDRSAAAASRRRHHLVLVELGVLGDASPSP